MALHLQSRTDGGSGPGLRSPGGPSILCDGGRGPDKPIADPTWPAGRGCTLGEGSPICRGALRCAHAQKAPCGLLE